MWPFSGKDSRAERSVLPKLDEVSREEDLDIRIGGYVDYLLQQNSFGRRSLEGGPPVKSLTEGQNVLASVAVFMAQVDNGGILQLFWNCPARVEHIAKSFHRLGLVELHEQYERAVRSVNAKFGDFKRLRRAGDEDAFVEAADEIDLEWFEAWYFGEYKSGKLVKAGGKQALQKAIVAYVLSNLDEFVRPST